MTIRQDNSGLIDLDALMRGAAEAEAARTAPTPAEVLPNPLTTVPNDVHLLVTRDPTSEGRTPGAAVGASRDSLGALACDAASAPQLADPSDAETLILRPRSRRTRHVAVAMAAGSALVIGALAVGWQVRAVPMNSPALLTSRVEARTTEKPHPVAAAAVATTERSALEARPAAHAAPAATVAAPSPRAAHPRLRVEKSKAAEPAPAVATEPTPAATSAPTAEHHAVEEPATPPEAPAVAAPAVAASAEAPSAPSAPSLEDAMREAVRKAAPPSAESSTAVSPQE